MKLFSGVALLAAASAFSNVAAAPAADVALAVRSDAALEERTLFGGWCVSLLGINLGSCGYWSKQNYDDYKYGCSKWGLTSKVIRLGSIWKYQWGKWQILDIDWKYHGKHWLPKDCTKWNFECPDPIVPKPNCPQTWIDGYHKACHKAGHEPHMWWDSSKNAYWFWFNGKFTLHIEFTLTKTGYCVPKTDAHNW